MTSEYLNRHLPCFNPPGTWMDGINIDLLYRWWRKKGMGRPLTWFRRDTGYGFCTASVETLYSVIEVGLCG